MALGLIVEYNPFHYGHLYHLNKSKKTTQNKDVIVVMSGNFVQRGLPAIFDKYTRTKMALLNGADIVIELPTLYSTSSAEFFAKESINILNQTGIVNAVSFGSECGSIQDMKKVSSFLLSEKNNKNTEYANILNKYLKEGLSYPDARNKACSHFISNDNILKSPNNILGIEYLKALEHFSSKIEPYTITRIKSDYNSEEIEGVITSATSIRNELFNNNYNNILQSVPTTSLDLIKSSSKISNYDNLSDIFHYILKTKNIDEIKNILDITEGLENRIISQADNNYLLSDIIKNVKTKRYTLTKIQRAILHILLNIDKDYFDYYNNLNGVQYIRVLGFKKDKSHILKDLSEKSTLPVILNLKNAKSILSDDALAMLNDEIKFTDIYNLTINKHIKNYEYKMPLVIL